MLLTALPSDVGFWNNRGTENNQQQRNRKQPTTEKQKTTNNRETEKKNRAPQTTNSNRVAMVSALMKTIPPQRLDFQAKTADI